MPEEHIPKNDFVQIQIREADLKQKVFEETLHELKTEQRFIQYFSDFDEASVQQFIAYYARQKAQWLGAGDQMVHYRNHQQVQWKYRAFECLGHIQHKKLFNLQCEWRAEKIKVAGFEICYDFDKWHRNILACTAIAPVNEEELEIYISYLQQLSDEKKSDDHEIGSDYRRLKNNFFETEHHDGDYPDWYRFYDEHFGTDILLALPDVRGEKEEFYLELWRKEKKPYWEAQRATMDQRPPIKTIYDRDFAEWFLKTFENKEILQLYHHTCAWDDEQAKTEMIEMDLINLQQAKEPVPVEDDDDWRKGINRAAEIYYRKKTIKILPGIWNEYRQRLKEGKPPMEASDYRFGAPEKDTFRDEILNYLLRGRELNGELRDLDF